MLDSFAQLFQHCWGRARSLRMVYKDLWVVSFPRCTAGPNIVRSCCIRLHTTANTHATTPNIVGATILGVVAFARSLNQMRFSKIFFTFKFFSEYSFKIANLLWHKLKVIFYCQSYDVIFAPKTVKTKNPKTHGCWEYKVLLSCKVSAQTVKN